MTLRRRRLGHQPASTRRRARIGLRCPPSPGAPFANSRHWPFVRRAASPLLRPPAPRPPARSQRTECAGKAPPPLGARVAPGPAGALSRLTPWRHSSAPLSAGGSRPPHSRPLGSAAAGASAPAASTAAALNRLSRHQPPGACNGLRMLDPAAPRSPRPWRRVRPPSHPQPHPQRGRGSSQSSSPAPSPPQAARCWVPIPRPSVREPLMAGNWDYTRLLSRALPNFRRTSGTPDRSANGARHTGRSEHMKRDYLPDPRPLDGRLKGDRHAKTTARQRRIAAPWWRPGHGRPARWQPMAQDDAPFHRRPHRQRPRPPAGRAPETTLVVHGAEAQWTRGDAGGGGALRGHRAAPRRAAPRWPASTCPWRERHAADGSGAFPHASQGSLPGTLNARPRLMCRGQPAQPTRVMSGNRRRAMTEAEMEAWALYLTTAPSNAPFRPVRARMKRADKLQWGGQLCRRWGSAEQGNPRAASTCHGASGSGLPPSCPISPGRYADYMVLTIGAWKAGKIRDNDGDGRDVHHRREDWTEEDMRRVSEGISPGSGPEADPSPTTARARGGRERARRQRARWRTPLLPLGD